MDIRQLKDKASQLFTKGKFAKAAEAYEEYCASDRKDHQTRLRLGDAWAKAGKKDKAVIAYAGAAEGFARDGFLPRAIAASKLVLELDPAHKGVQKMLADLYAQKSGGGRAKAAAPAPEMEISRNVSTPVTSSFANRKDAIDLDAPVAAAPKKPTRAAPEAPSPMNRADALELPEYEIPMDDGPSSIGGMSAQKGPNPNRRLDAIEIESVDEGDAGPKALVETAIELDVPVKTSLPAPDELPPELQVAPPLPTPAEEIIELTVPKAVPAPQPSAPAFELTEEAEAPPPAPPPEEIVVGEAVPEVVSFDVAAVIEVETVTGEELEQGEVIELDAVEEPESAPLLHVVESAAAAATAREAASVEVSPARAVETKNVQSPQVVATEAPAPSLHDTERSAETAPEEVVVGTTPLPPAVGDAETAPPSIAPVVESAPPGLKPRKTEIPSSSPSSSRIWLPPGFSAPAAAPIETVAPAPVSPLASLTASMDGATDLERSLAAFSQFDVDAAPAPVEVPAPAPVAAKVAFTELDLDDGDSLLNSVALAPAAPVEEPMDAPDDARPAPGELPKIPLFSDLPEDAFIALFEKCPLQRFEQGQLIFEQGDEADAFFVICAGSAKVFRTDHGARRDIATLEEGSFFGEMALLSDAPRSASVEAADEDTQVLTISAEVLKELSGEHPSVAVALKKFARQRMLSNLMNSAALFAPFNRNDRRELVARFRARDVQRGEVLVKQGQPSDGLYVVLSGEVEVEANGKRIAGLKEGQVFGEMSLMTRSAASATVKASRRTSLLRLPKHDFDELILSHPQVLEHIATLIDERKKADAKRA